MEKSLTIAFIVVLLQYGLVQAEARPGSRDYQKANQLFAASRFQDSLSLYQKLLLSPPEGVPASEIRTRIGDAWFRLGSFDKALDAYRGSLPDLKLTARPETQYWIGFCCFLLGRDAEAVGEFLKIPQLYPGSGMWVGTAYYWAGRASERMGRVEEAAAYYRKAGGNGKSTQAKFANRKARAAKAKSAK